MDNISQICMVDCSEIEILGDLERLKIFFENINGKKLYENIEKET